MVLWVWELNKNTCKQPVGSLAFYDFAPHSRGQKIWKDMLVRIIKKKTPTGFPETEWFAAWFVQYVMISEELQHSAKYFPWGKVK